VDALYQIPLVEFTAARNALAAERKALGDKEGAARVKALAKPSAVAWAVNQVFWRDRLRFDALVGAMVEVAAAQKEAWSGGGGAQLRDAMRRRSEALADLARRAERHLVAGGSASSPAVLQRLTTTLEALASPRAKDDEARLRPGRLATELMPAGFDLALGLDSLHLPPVPARPAAETAAAPPTAPTREEEAAAREAQARIRSAEAETALVRRELLRARTALQEAEARAEAARTDVATHEARAAEARARAERQEAAEADARRTLERLLASLAEAEARLEEARRS